MNEQKLTDALVVRFTLGFRCEECSHEETLYFDCEVTLDDKGGSSVDDTAKLTRTSKPYRAERDKAAELHAKVHTPVGENNRWRRVRIVGLHAVKNECNCGGCRKETVR